jgi:hypothetical protein
VMYPICSLAGGRKCMGFMKRRLEFASAIVATAFGGLAAGPIAACEKSKNDNVGESKTIYIKSEFNGATRVALTVGKNLKVFGVPWSDANISGGAARPLEIIHGCTYQNISITTDEQAGVDWPIMKIYGYNRNNADNTENRLNRLNKTMAPPQATFEIITTIASNMWEYDFFSEYHRPGLSHAYHIKEIDKIPFVAGCYKSMDHLVCALWTSIEKNIFVEFTVPGPVERDILNGGLLESYRQANKILNNMHPRSPY